MTFESTPDGLLSAAGGSIEPFPPKSKRSADGKPDSVYKLIDPTSLEYAPIADRDWIVHDWLPIGNVAAIYGDGGMGKTLLAQQLMTSCATGAPWCGLQIARCRSLALFCEDDEDELHRRQARINAALGVGFADLADMRWVSGVGYDNALVNFLPDGRMFSTDRLARIQAESERHKAKLIIIDTAADVFPGNENDRHQVRQFIGALTKMANVLKAAVLLPAHPSRSGMGTGNLDGGSTAWNNSVRSRWSLAKPGPDGENRPSEDQRILTRRKANYAAVGDTINLRWADGVLIPDDQGGGALSGTIQRQAADELFLQMIERCNSQGQHVSGSKNSGNYGPKMFAARADAGGYRAKDFEQAMTRLFTQKRIRLQQYGRPGDYRQEIACTPKPETETSE